MKFCLIFISLMMSLSALAQPKVGCPPCQPYDFHLGKGHEKLMKLGEELIHRFNQVWKQKTGKSEQFTSFTEIYMTLSFLHLKYLQSESLIDTDQVIPAPASCKKEMISGEDAKNLLKELLTPDIRRDTLKFLDELAKTMGLQLEMENQRMIKNVNAILNFPAYK